MELYVTMERGRGEWGITNERGEKMRRGDKRSALQRRGDFCNVVCTVSVRGTPTANVVISRRDLDRSNVERWWWHDGKNRTSSITTIYTVDNTCIYPCIFVSFFRSTLDDRSKISTFVLSPLDDAPFILRTRQLADTQKTRMRVYR